MGARTNSPLLTTHVNQGSRKCSSTDTRGANRSSHKGASGLETLYFPAFSIDQASHTIAVILKKAHQSGGTLGGSASAVWGHAVITDQHCKSAKPRDQDYKLADEKGLYLQIKSTGYKVWRLKYRFGGKEKRLTFGPYPEVSLREARDKRDAARRRLRDGEDPGEVHKRTAARRYSGIDPAGTFRAIALHWHAMQQPQWKQKHAADVLHSLETEVFPAIGSRPIAEVTPAEIRELLEQVQARGAVETAHRIRGRISSVFQVGMGLQLVASDPAASVAWALKPIVRGMQPALLKLKDCRAFLRAMEAEPAQPATKLASRLLALTAARPGMIRLAELHEFEGLDTAQPIWRVPAEKMKLVRAESEQDAFEFIVPLAGQAVATVRAAADFAANRKYLFPSVRHSHRPFTDNALNTNYRRVPGFGGRHVPHGWRASFSTIMNERAIELDRPGDRAIIDLMLAHRPAGVEGRYNRAAYMPRRRELAQEWANLLLEGVAGPETLVEGPRKS